MNANLLGRLWKWVLGLLRRPKDADEHPWCLVGNIVDENPKGDSKEIVRGTKRFSPGTKVYCMPPQWGDGYESVVVIGRSRGSKRWITVVQRVSKITNWRAKPVYHPEVLRRLKEGWDAFHGQWKSKKEVEKAIKYLLKRAAKENDPTSGQ